MKERHLILIFAVLLVPAILGLSVADDPGHPMLGLIGWLSVTLILELPSLWWRRRGGSPLSTLVLALVCPLVILEGLMIFPAYKYSHAGGDLQGIEILIMEFVIPIAVLLTAPGVTLFALLAVRPAGPNGAR